jgi:hypothetical protein
MQTILGHFSNNWRDFRHLVTIWLRVFAHQLVLAATARARLDVMHFLDLLNRHQFPGRALVSWLPTSLAPTLGPLAWLSRHIRPIAGWWP